MTRFATANGRTQSAAAGTALAVGSLLLFGCSAAPGTGTADPAASAGSPGGTTPTTATEPGPTSGPQEPTAAPNPVLERLRLENGLDVMLLRHEATLARVAEFGVVLPEGTDTGNPGAAELALHLLLEGSDLTAGRLPLAREIERLGGTVHARVGRKSVWLYVRVPQETWQRAARALGAALTAPAAGREGLERARRTFVERRTAAIAEAPVETAVQRLLLGEAGPGAHLEALSARDPGEARDFAAAHFGAGRSLLAVRVPAALATQRDTAKKEFGGWAPGAATATATAPRAAPGGIAWIEIPDAPDAAPCEVALVHELPDPLRQDAAVLTTLLDCVTEQGIGGRFERLLQEVGLGRLDFAPSVEDFGASKALVLRTMLTRDQVGPVWQAFSAARRSLATLQPTRSEREQALAHASLAPSRADRSGSESLRTLVVAAQLGLAGDHAARQLAAAALPDAIDAAAIEAFLSLPSLLVVRGPAAPTDLAGVQPCKVLPSDLVAPPLAEPNDAMVTAAAPWRRRAVEAVGGSELLDRVQGFAGARRVTAEGAPEITESLTYGIAGDLQRTRSVLGSAIETSLRESNWTERVGDTQVQLNAREAAWRRLDAERHPLAILAAWQQDRLHFRLLTTRTEGDREHVVLECVDANTERLRIELDRGSALLRVVETWALSPEGTATHTVDRWTDYRTVDGVRVPFRCSTQVDEGKGLRVSTWERVQPMLR